MSTKTEIRAIQRTTLPNGLRVVAAPDHSSPLVGVAVAYDVGFRSEPKGRTGFAHLFEHLMFEGSANVGKSEFARLIESAGGVLNGHTLADLTAYYEALPSSALELALFLEADRMRAPAVTEENLRNQVAVVEEEIKVNVLNQPYGGFPWISLPEVAFDTYENSHNGYGDFSHLEDASLSDASSFHASYYAPSNAILTVAGDCDADDVFRLAERYFGSIASSPAPSHGPWHERALRADRHKVIEDPLAPQPAFALGYRTPDPIVDLDGLLAYAVAASVLADGDASRLRSRLVHREHIVTDVSCYLGLFGVDSFFMRDPVLFQAVVNHPGIVATDEIIGAIDEEIFRLADLGPTPDELARVSVGTASAFWRELDPVIERASTFASLEVVHGRAELALELPQRIGSVSASEVAAAARDLLAQHRTVVEIEPVMRDESA